MCNNSKTETVPSFFQTVVHCFSPYRGKLAILFLALMVQAGYRVLVPVGYEYIFDDAIGNSDLDLLLHIVLALTGGWVMYGVAGVIQDYLSAWIGSHIIRDLREKMFVHLQQLSENYFSHVDSGALISRFSNDLAILESGFIRGTYIAAFSLIILTLSLGLMFTLHWPLALGTVMAFGGGVYIPKLLGRWARKQSYQRKSLEAGVLVSIQETIAAQTTLRVFSLGDHMLARFRERVDKLTDGTLSAFYSSALVGRTATQSVLFVQVGIVGVGASLTIKGILSPGELVGFAALLMNVANASNHIASVVPDLLQAAAGMQRIQEFLVHEREGEMMESSAPLPRISTSITFDQVSFGYEEGQPILQKISLKICAGESLAIVGGSGSGKSTFLSLLTRMYDPNAGQISIDGRDIKKVCRESLRSQIGVVLQNTSLLNVSLAENIRIGNLNATDEEIEKVAKMAEIHDMILSLPDGYQTRVGESGNKLSVGQRQRIAIARALLRNPSILILDEATSALDPATEYAVNETLNQVRQGRTTLSSTHRLSSIKQMNRILVLDKGILVEQGTHGELLEKRGKYFELWQKQSGFTVSDDGVSAVCEPDRLAQIPLFHKVDRNGLKTLTDYLVSEFYPLGRTLFVEGDRGEKFYIIVKGTVEVLNSINGREQVKDRMHDGDFFGELALLDETSRNATIRTVTPSLFLTLERHHFNHLLDTELELREVVEGAGRERRL